MGRSHRDHPEYVNQKRRSPSHGDKSQNAPDHGDRKADIAIQIPFHMRIVPPALMVHFFDHMTGDPFRQRGKDHTSKKQPDPPEVSAYQHQCRSGNSIDHTERSVYKASVYKAFLPHRRCHGLKNPAGKAVGKKQPQPLISGISHPSSPVLSVISRLPPHQ